MTVKKRVIYRVNISPTGKWSGKRKNSVWNINQDFMSSGLSLFKKHLTNQYQTDYVQQEVVSNSVGFIPINLQA